MLAALLRGDHDAAATAIDITELPDRARYHGVSGLILESALLPRILDKGAIERLRRHALGSAVWEMRHRQIVAPILDQFAAAGIWHVLLKGSALAYDLYAEPSQRPRGDTDVLMSLDRVDDARRILQDNGFVRFADRFDPQDVALSRQETWIRTADDGTEHGIDLHWAIMKDWTLAEVISSDDVRATARPLARFSANAMAISRPLAMIHACVHRYFHVRGAYFVGGDAHYGGDRLIWLYDVLLLGRQLTDDEWQEVVAKARAADVADIVAETLDLTQASLGLGLPPEMATFVLAERAQAGFARRHLVEAGYFKHYLSELRAIEGNDRKLRFIWSIIFPPEQFARRMYPTMARWPAFAVQVRLLLRDIGKAVGIVR